MGVVGFVMAGGGARRSSAASDRHASGWIFLVQRSDRGRRPRSRDARAGSARKPRATGRIDIAGRSPWDGRAHARGLRHRQGNEVGWATARDDRNAHRLPQACGDLSRSRRGSDHRSCRSACSSCRGATANVSASSGPPRCSAGFLHVGSVSQLVLGTPPTGRSRSASKPDHGRVLDRTSPENWWMRFGLRLPWRRALHGPRRYSCSSRGLGRREIPCRRAFRA